MPKTPRFVAYTSKDEIFIIHMYQPRFVAMVVNEHGMFRVYPYEVWEQATDELIKSICIKMKDWYYFKNK